MINFIIKNSKPSSLRYYFCFKNDTIQKFIKNNQFSKQQLISGQIIDQINNSLKNSSNYMMKNFLEGNYKKAESQLLQNKILLKQALQDLNDNSNSNLFECLTFANAKTDTMLSECYIKQSKYESAAQSLQDSLILLQNLDKSSNQVVSCLLDALILQYQQILYSEFDDELIIETEQQIKQLYNENQKFQEIQEKYQVFQIKYLEDNQEKVDKMFADLDSIQKTIDLADFLMKKAINKGSSSSALLYCEFLLSKLVEQFDPNHYLFENALTNYFALSRENNQTLQSDAQILKLKNKFSSLGFDAFDKIMKFEGILQEGLKVLANQKNSTDINQVESLLKELEKITFSSGTKYHRYAVYMILGLKRGLKEVNIM